MDRRIKNSIIKDLSSKIVLLSGPRQVGKTTLAQSISKDSTYLNYDIVEHRKIIIEQSWAKNTELVILDELHKMKNWKNFLKGIYDSQNNSNAPKQKTIVTGSARLDIAKKMGDSLAGRHFSYTLNPLVLKELSEQAKSPFQTLMERGGFPEPFLNSDENFYKRWQTSHLDIIIRQDLIDLEQVNNISKIELLVELLRYKVGSPCSYSSLAEDLQVSPITVKKWLVILENLFIIFSVTPYHKNVARSILKTPKYYFYDLGRVPENDGARFENLVALHLKSEIDFLKDTTGRKIDLNYLRNRNGNEIDFLINEEKDLLLAIEAKYSDTNPDKSFKVFFGANKLNSKNYVQVIAKDCMPKEYDSGLKIESAENWLTKFEI